MIFQRQFDDDFEEQVISQIFKDMAMAKTTDDMLVLVSWMLAVIRLLFANIENLESIAVKLSETNYLLGMSAQNRPVRIFWSKN